MAELVDAADSKSVFERSGSSSLPRGTILKKDLEIQGLFFRPQESGFSRLTQSSANSPPAVVVRGFIPAPLCGEGIYSPLVARGFIPAGPRSGPHSQPHGEEEPVAGEEPVARELAPA